jgi:hypothetical protein
LETGDIATLVEKVDEPADGEFTGLYAQNLPTNCWARYNNEDYLVTITTWRCQSVNYYIVFIMYIRIHSFID